MQLEDDKKIDILLTLLKERYEASHKMRERSYKFSVWILGVGVALIWLILSRPEICIRQRTVLTFVIIIIGALAFQFLRSIDKGFANNKEVMIRIEQILGCYDQDIYIGGECLYPRQYGTNRKNGFSHFLSLYTLLVAVGLAVIVLLWS
jgi:uncharacterized membrane protein YsdA (DUF1294 family)